MFRFWKERCPLRKRSSVENVSKQKTWLLLKTTSLFPTEDLHPRKSGVVLMAAWGVRNPYLYIPIQVIQIQEQKDGSQMYYVHW